MKILSSTLGNRVLLKRTDAPEKIGSFIIPDTVKEDMKPTQGAVVATSLFWTTPEGKNINSMLKKGDQVIYDHYKGVPVTIDQEEYLVLNEGDIFLIL